MGQLAFDLLRLIHADVPQFKYRITIEVAVVKTCYLHCIHFRNYLETYGDLFFPILDVQT